MNHVLQICGEKDPEAVRFLNEILARAAKAESSEAGAGPKAGPKAVLKRQKERKNAKLWCTGRCKTRHYSRERAV